MLLSSSQLKAFVKVQDRENVFVTGSAGTGKSQLIKELTELWDREKKAYALTATTGIAAMNIGGKTLHSFLWLLIEDDEATSSDIVRRLQKKPSFKFFQKTICSLRAIVIDEVSMLSSSMFAKVSEVLQVLRSCGSPFGGLQVVLVGDFFQLGAVKKDLELLFESAEFKRTIGPNIVVLQETFRQTNPLFIELLGRMRTASLTAQDLEILKARVDADITRFGIKPTELWSTNKDVDRYNNDRLSQIASEPVVYKAHVGIRSTDLSGEAKKTALDKFLKETNVTMNLELKPPVILNDEDSILLGTQVMLTFNLDTPKGLVNGSRGVILDFVSPPLASCVSKSIFEDFDAHDPSSLKVYIHGIKMPKVRFIVDNKPVILLVPFVRLSRQAQPKTLCYAWTLPLKLAWATTVHKSQGQSLDLVKVSLDASVFAYGQAYVALSRARSLEGLSLVSFDPSVVKADPKVLEFYKSL